MLQSLLTILAAPDMASRRWVWEQYDNSVMNDTIQHPGGDAAVVRVHGRKKALAITTDVTPRYCRPDPGEGDWDRLEAKFRRVLQNRLRCELARKAGLTFILPNLRSELLAALVTLDQQVNFLRNHLYQ